VGCTREFLGSILIGVGEACYEDEPKVCVSLVKYTAKKRRLVCGGNTSRVHHRGFESCCNGQFLVG